MNWLFDNPLINLPGPYFLMFYAFAIAAAAIALKIIKSKLDFTGQMPLPPIPTEPDAFEIAFLRGGSNELARAATFALNQKGLIEISQNGKETWIQQTASANPALLNPLERAVFNYYAEPRKPKDLFQKNGLKEILQPFSSTYEARLAAQHFLTDAAAKAQVIKISLAFAAAIIGLGFYKLLAAVLYGNYNIGFLILFGFIGIIILGVMANPPRLTEHGKKYLERLQLAFEKFKYASIPKTQNQPAATTFAAVDPLLLTVGLFGTAALAGTAYDNYNQAFHKSQQAQGSAGGSGCGSSCGTSSDSSSCSSGGDGGGGGCGGGCGGCG